MDVYKKDNDLPWIEVASGAPYFITETGQNWTPIGQNDAITWPDLKGLFRKKDIPAVERYLEWLSANGVTCIRLMLEYAQGQHRYFENPAGTFSVNMVRLWDELFRLCAKYHIRILLTPVDTFWMWIRWKHHPYNRLNGGPCKKRSEWLTCPDTLQAIKKRLTFVTTRWGGSGVLFAWDLWNEIHPAHAGGKTEYFATFIDQLSQHLRDTELRLFGRSHPQTVSVFGPVLEERPVVAEVIFGHPMLDFANTHFYDAATIDNPKNTVGAAVCTGRLVREALSHLPANRPFFDSEHGPIHAFKDKHITFPAYFDDEYFRHMQWAHLASGAAGGGMRWPNRHPHSLTPGMRLAQRSLAAFTQLIDWRNFRRKNLNEEVKASSARVTVFACADQNQAVLWLLRTDILVARPLKVLNDQAEPIAVTVTVPDMDAGEYSITIWNTLRGTAVATAFVTQDTGGDLSITVPVLVTDAAVAVRLVSAASR